MYRSTPTFYHTPFTPYSDPRLSPDSKAPAEITPNSTRWAAFPIEPDGDFITSQRVIARSGDPSTKTGCAYLIYAAIKDMPEKTVFYSADGDYLVVPQAGTLDIETELGSLLVRQNEIVVIPRGIRYRVTLPNGPARGYICELYHGHFQLPELGPIGSCSLANARDFQVPVAVFDGTVGSGGMAKATETGPWAVIAKMNAQYFSCEQGSTPFDVAAWHGTYYPYKYDLGRYSVLGSLLYDHPDPSLFTVLTAPSNRETGSATLDFAIIPPRWQVMEDTFWPPYYHRNTMSEFSGSIINSQDPNFPLAQGATFKPYVAVLNNAMVPHGMDKKTFEAAREIEFKPTKVGLEGFMIFLFESENMMGVTEWGRMAAGQHGIPSSSKRGKSKI
jgi:homogentisate 1,2-dioxygenase